MEEPEPFVLLPFHGLHQRAVSAVTFAPTSSQLAASSFTSNHSSPTNQGRTLAASASADGTVRTWEITGDMLDAAPKYSSTQQEETSSGGVLSPDVQIVDSTPDDVTNRNESKPTATNAPSPNTNTHSHTNKHTKNSQPLTPLSTLIGHSRGINDVTFNRTSHYLATASDDKTLRLWDVTTQHQHSCKHSQPLVEFRSHTNFAFSVRFNPQSNLLVSGSFDETVKLWDVRSGECVSTIPAHSDPVTGVDFSRDGSCIVSGSHDGLIRIWDVATSECLKTIYADGNSPVGHVGFSPNGKYVLAGTLDSRLRLWHVGTKAGYEKHGVNNTTPDFDSSPGLRGKCSKTYSGHLNTKHCLFASFAGMHGLISRHSIVTGSEDGRVHVYGLQSRKVRQVLCGHVDAVLAVAAHDSKDLLCSGGMTKDRTVRFWVPGKNEMAF
mmetsp:Transcript_63605/g.74500  ORF Transcript_63605/g.74500 Transcript_63605/m.74500 type:complete len:437 (-) Transcript_63605:200-1510(-)|eukprot:CAMPEP_0194362400 /NCGR_PEP_ID=MMETSP0174-20130528/10145_1 /TAXON_ID=216777 /ORGANISM="Proboscia alata, Strain PI-D3" /LENGTH=436 /DNA_ID=CAMNT_0039135245 /DNA_START=21 /DNA_END=1331 /DNA_ORIENTATION=-